MKDTGYEAVEERLSLSAKEFTNHYADKEIAVKVPNFLGQSDVAVDWNLAYLREVLGSTKVPVKTFTDDGQIDLSSWPMERYVDAVEQYELKRTAGKIGTASNERPPYCHDVPIFHLSEKLVSDVRSMPKEYFPKWYANNWWDYAQFFVSPTGSVTPLHFDTLLTHNIFFQVCGTKEFILYPKTESGYFDRHNWRWFKVDPLSAKANNTRKSKHPGMRVVLNAGDMLYMPPGMLHHVTTTDASISFNVDFHTRKSVVRSFLSVFKKMPINSLYYNVILFLGVALKVPSRFLFKYYRSYLNYVS